MKSEWQLLADLTASGSGALSNEEIYKACVAVAINGQQRLEESQLTETQQQLLRCRRLIYMGNLKLAKKIAQNILELGSLSALEKGDAHFVLGTILNRQGNRLDAKSNFMSAADLYSDPHKQLRAVINAKICERKAISYLSGELYVLGQSAVRNKFYDLAGNMHKAMAIELLNAGKFAAAVKAAERAEGFYSLDGCPEDRSVNVCLLAIAYLLVGRTDLAKSEMARVVEPQGKVQSYFDLYTSLLYCRKIILVKGHPLEKLPKQIRSFKSNSVGSKILKLLTKKAMKRDELISAIWGENAIDPSYCNRLYTAINLLKTKHQYPIIFDGECYQII